MAFRGSQVRFLLGPPSVYIDIFVYINVNYSLLIETVVSN